ncbi:MAG: hypothetical protein IKJ83_02710 [Ruminococcus sp.]|nr:hypothetical protein [Ruminococcus sp.]
MITVENGKLTIPEHKRFIGFAGDNLVQNIEILFKGAKDSDTIYRIFLTFDDGSVNCFTLPSRITEEGAVLLWQVKREHIFKSGVVTAQIKSYTSQGVVSYTTKDTFIVGSSAELSDYFKDNSTEFSEYEKKLNELVELFREVSILMPYIGENGNWYYYDSTQGGYVDSGKPSAGKAESTDIADGSVTGEKLADGAVDRVDVFSQEMRSAFLSMPLKKILVAGDITDDYYNGLTEPGIYQIDTYSGKHYVLVVLKPSSDAYLMQMLFMYDKVLYRGIFCSEDGIYAEDDWSLWVNLCQCGMKKAEKFFVANSLGKNIDPHILSYQTDDNTTDNHVRIPLSMLKERIMSITDAGEYFVSENVEGALQELGAELKGVSELLSRI